MNQDFTVKKKQYLSKKKFRAGVSPEKKFLHKQCAKKKFVPAENPPPHHHFSNGPSLCQISTFNNIHEKKFSILIG